MGPFPASINVLCNPVRPYLPAAGNALVREGARNLVVILWKSESFFVRFPRRMKPAVFGARPTARNSLNSKLSWLSVHKPAHADVHYNPQRQKHEQY